MNSSPHESPKNAGLSWFILTILIVGLAFFFGNIFKWQSSAEKVSYYELENFSKVLEYIESNYVEEVDADKLIRGAIQGMLSNLDPHSAFLAPDIYREMKEETSGQFGGVGIEVSVKNKAIVVVAPIEDTPAFRAGIKGGDKIIEINGQSTKNLDLNEAINLMRGKPGSPIAVKILRPSDNKVYSFEMKREKIKMRSVLSSRLPGDYGYLRISQFIEHSAEDLAKAMLKLDEEASVKGWILDLRGNPGGLLDQAVKVSNLFIDEGPIVYTMGRNTKQQDIESAQKGRQITKAPVVVLIDGSSASASEIVAGALQDHKRGLVAGQPSFGKGSVQTIIPLGKGAGLKLTIARYYTPSGRSIQAKGIVPDVPLDQIDSKLVEESRKKNHNLKEVDLKGHFENEESTESSSEESTAEAEEGTPAEEETKPLSERLKSDYMITQSLGILKTMNFVTNSQLERPKFKIENESSEEK